MTGNSILGFVLCFQSMYHRQNLPFSMSIFEHLNILLYIPILSFSYYLRYCFLSYSYCLNKLLLHFHSVVSSKYFKFLFSPEMWHIDHFRLDIKNMFDLSICKIFHFYIALSISHIFEHVRQDLYTCILEIVILANNCFYIDY